MLRLEGQLEDAYSLHSEALALLQGQLGSEHPRVGSTLMALGQIKAQMGQSAEAEALFRKALKVRKENISMGWKFFEGVWSQNKGRKDHMTNPGEWHCWIGIGMEACLGFSADFLRVCSLGHPRPCKKLMFARMYASFS